MIEPRPPSRDPGDEFGAATKRREPSIAALAAAEGFDRHACLLARTLAHFLERRGHWSRWAAVQRVA